ncbi:MAG: glutathione S-transferase [Alphaproteobacteria bacterium]|nr:glutathione S-transferase [Alphaproteobacteria bacterium]
MGKIVLYFSVASRSFIPLWMLEELGIPFDIADTDIRKRKHKRPEYLKINPMGKVPALSDDGVVITEAPAICLHLADRYGYGTFAPKIEDPDRGPYLKWMVFSTAVFEPAAWLPPAVTESRPQRLWLGPSGRGVRVAGNHAHQRPVAARRALQRRRHRARRPVRHRLVQQPHPRPPGVPRVLRPHEHPPRLPASRAADLAAGVVQAAAITTFPLMGRV